MYHTLKQFLKTIIPSKYIYSSELFFRFFYSLFFRGSKYQCNICQTKLRKFIDINTANYICPACGASGRNRRLWNILNKNLLTANTKILHFSPSRSLFRKLKRLDSIEYNSSDFAGEFFADKQLDITQIDEGNETFDLVICYHILEHIENDQKAISELYRILKPGAICLIQTPFKEGDIFEDSTINTPQKRLEYFEQEDHVRIYSAEGLQGRLSKTGFKVEIKQFEEEKENYFGFKQQEIVLFAKK